MTQPVLLALAGDVATAVRAWAMEHPLLAVGLSAQAATVGLAWTIFLRRRREHLPFAIFATVALAVDLARWAYLTAFPWLTTAGPWTGWRRAAWHADVVLFNAWPVGLAAAAWVVFLRRRPWPPLIAAGLVLAGLAAGYPTVRGELLGRAYGAIHVAGLSTALITAALWARRRALPRPEHGAVLFVAMLDIAALAGPFALPAPWATWAEVDKLIAATWSGLLLIHAGALWAGFLMEPESPPDVH